MDINPKSGVYLYWSTYKGNTYNNLLIANNKIQAIKHLKKTYKETPVISTLQHIPNIFTTKPYHPTPKLLKQLNIKTYNQNSSKLTIYVKKNKYLIQGYKIKNIV